MDEMAVFVFSAQDLRFHVIESQSYVDVCVMLFFVGVGLHVCSQDAGICGIDGHCADSNGNLVNFLGFIENFFHVLRVVESYLLRAVDDDLGSEDFLFPKGGLIGTLAVSKYLRRVGIFPSVMVPVGDVLAQDDQMSAGR